MSCRGVRVIGQSDIDARLWGRARGSEWKENKHVWLFDDGHLVRTKIGPPMYNRIGDTQIGTREVILLCWHVPRFAFCEEVFF